VVESVNTVGRLRSLAAERIVAHFQHVPQRPAVELFGQQVEEGGEIVGIETALRRELPEDRAQPVAQFREPAEHEGIDLPTDAGQRFRLGDPARRLQRKDETVRRLAAPLGVDGRFLGAVEGAVDFDRGEVATGVFEFAALHQSFRIEVLAPGREGPAADADANRPRSVWCGDEQVIAAVMRRLHRARSSMA
jgi:hypothetical protein